MGTLDFGSGHNENINQYDSSSINNNFIPPGSRNSLANSRGSNLEPVLEEQKRIIDLKGMGDETSIIEMNDFGSVIEMPDSIE